LIELSMDQTIGSIRAVLAVLDSLKIAGCEL
jgi:hypothetical protein